MISVIRRDDTNLNLTFTNKADGTPIDITGYSVFFTVKQNIGDTDAEALIAKKVTSHSDAVNGKTTILITHIDSDLSEGDYMYDFQLVDTGGTVSSSQRDVFSVLNDVTIRTS